MCVDYMNLNDTCLNDSFSLPQIDQIVDSTSGNRMFSFLDTFYGYHQIPMFHLDQEKLTFITPHGLYCYNVMSFRLKKTGVTYQRLMKKIFKPLIGRTMEVYIDNIVVKSKTCMEHMQHLEEVFTLMWKYNMKFKPLKSAFGVSVGKFLGFLVTQQGIEINPDEVKVVLETPVLSTKKEMKQLKGCFAALGLFIAQFTDKLHSFFTTLHGAQKFITE